MYYRLLLLLFVCVSFACSRQGKVESYEVVTIELGDSVAADIGYDTAMAAYIAPFKEEIDALESAILNHTEMPMEKGQPEGLLGNFVADLVFEMGNRYYREKTGQSADLCLLNNGGLRAPLPQGGVSRKNVFELMPFENEIVVLTLTGENILGLLEYVAHVGGAPLSNVKMGIRDGKPVDIYIGGVPFDMSQHYKVITSDYLAHGGDKMQFFKDPIKWEDAGVKIRDAIEEYMVSEKEEGRKLTAAKDQRIYYAE